jgi:hypothetical protein
VRSDGRWCRRSSAASALTNAVCPITSVVLGRVVFLETPQRTTGGKIVPVVSLGLLLAGLGLLARGQAARAGETPAHAPG